MLHWGDFAAAHARPRLDRYRDRLLTCNDDIQGTAAVTLGALVGAVNATQSRISEQTVVLLGAGSAGIGVAAGTLLAITSPLQTVSVAWIEAMPKASRPTTKTTPSRPNESGAVDITILRRTRK